MTDQPNTAPPPVPEWALIGLPPFPPGVQPPAFPAEFKVGLTAPDADGHSWAVLIIGDGTVTGQVRIPAMLAEQVGAGIHEGLANIQRQAEQRSGAGGLVLPNGGAGGLFVPTPGQGGMNPGPMPGPNRAERRHPGGNGR
jgi:hypothetical protein